MIHTLDTANRVIMLLRSNGFTNVKLIGSLSKGKVISTNDIDILLESYNTSLEIFLSNLFKPKGLVEITDWNGLYFNDTKYGNIDVFFSDKEFDY